MKKAKIIRIFLVPHVEVRIHVSKEMEEDYEHERSTGLTGNKNGTKQPWKK